MTSYIPQQLGQKLGHTGYNWKYKFLLVTHTGRPEFTMYSLSDIGGVREYKALVEKGSVCTDITLCYFSVIDRGTGLSCY